MEGEVTYFKKHVVGAFLVGLVVGIGAFYVWTNQGTTSGAKEKIMNADTEENADEAMIVGSANSVLVDDQDLGMLVIVDRLTMSQDGWIVIHADDNGTPGARLGASRRDAGTYEKVEVDLLMNTEEGRTYYAMIHADNGDRQFDHTVDLPIENSQGLPVMAAFVALPL